MNPVKTEYPKPEPFDVVVLTPEIHAGRNAWNQPVRIGLEIKFWQADGAGDGLGSDRQKLEKYSGTARQESRRFTGLCLVFCHRREEPRLVEEVARGGIVKNPGTLSIPGHGVEAWAFTS